MAEDEAETAIPGDSNDGLPDAQPTKGDDTEAATPHGPHWDEITRLYELVPEIGAGWRWYDIPYRFFRWTLRSLPRRTFSWRMRIRLNNALNFFIPFNEYQRYKRHSLDDPSKNLIVPAEEELTQGAIWVLELFPPSFYGSLQDSLRKQDEWAGGLYRDALDGSNADRVTRARRGQGFSWSMLGSVRSPKSQYLAMDAKTENLPREFDLIEISAVQIGPSITAVVAFVRLSKFGQAALGRVWHSQHEPTLEWQGFRRPHIESRYFAAIRATQSERERLHGLAREWLARRCPGYFAGTDKLQPVLDLSLFQTVDPTTLPLHSYMNDPLRALGMDPGPFRRYVSEDVKGVVFAQGEALDRKNRPLQNCWGVVGSHEVMESLSEREGYGDKPYSPTTLAAMYNDELRSFLVYTSLAQYTHRLRETASEARDTARQRHRGFKPSQLEQLKREMLTISLDLPVVARDAALPWEHGWRYFNSIDVQGIPTEEMAGKTTQIDLIEIMGQQCEESFKSLIEDDAAYRNVLSTVATLGASAASARLSRRAFFISVISLTIAGTALLSANNASGWHSILSWLSEIF